jgi:hypothetical protein
MYPLFTLFKTITFHHGKVNLNYILVKSNKDKEKLKYLLVR